MSLFHFLSFQMNFQIRLNRDLKISQFCNQRHPKNILKFRITWFDHATEPKSVKFSFFSGNTLNLGSNSVYCCDNIFQERKSQQFIESQFFPIFKGGFYKENQSHASFLEAVWLPKYFLFITDQWESCLFSFIMFLFIPFLEVGFLRW